MKCVNCAAALPSHSDICTYCFTVNDRNLHAVGGTVIHGEETTRCCPRCDAHLCTVNIGNTERFHVERCDTCHGLFFDVAELDAYIDLAVDTANEVLNKRLNAMIEERGTDRQWDTSYVKCPVCQKLMNRKAYGMRSGVIVDTCKEHGVWVDGGELAAIIRWAQAGGKMHHENRVAEKEVLDQRVKALSAPILGEHALSEPDTAGSPLMSFMKTLLDG